MRHFHARIDLLTLTALGLVFAVAFVAAAFVYDSWIRESDVFAPIEVDMAPGAETNGGRTVNIAACNNSRSAVGGFLIASWEDPIGQRQSGRTIVAGSIASGCFDSSLTVEGDGWRVFVFGLIVGPREESQAVFEVLGDGE